MHCPNILSTQLVIYTSHLNMAKPFPKQTDNRLAFKNKKKK